MNDDGRDEDRPSHEVTFEAVARADAFVREADRRAAARDWPRLLGEIRKALEQLAGSDLIASDPVASAILASMAETVDMEEFDFLAEQLRLRAAEVIAAGAGAAHAAPLAARRAPAEIAKGSSMFDTGQPRRGRTVLKI
jgi:hypothetical protein